MMGSGIKRKYKEEKVDFTCFLGFAKYVMLENFLFFVSCIYFEGPNR